MALATTSETVRTRFDLELKDRACSWNCVDIDDCFPGFKGPKAPKLFENGANLYKWQFTDPNAFGHYQSAFTLIPSAKNVVQCNTNTLRRLTLQHNAMINHD